jgi:MFS family permease
VAGRKLIHQAAGRLGDGRVQQPARRELREGLRFVRAHTVMLSVILVATVGNFLDKPLMVVVLPVYARTFYTSPTSLGLALGAFGAGALVGSLLFGAVGRGWPRRRTFLTCWVLGPPVVFGTLAATPPLPVLVAAGFVGGCCSAPSTPWPPRSSRSTPHPSCWGGSLVCSPPWPRPASRSGRSWPAS